MSGRREVRQRHSRVRLRAGGVGLGGAPVAVVPRSLADVAERVDLERRREKMIVGSRFMSRYGSLVWIHIVSGRARPVPRPTVTNDKLSQIVAPLNSIART